MKKKSENSFKEQMSRLTDRLGLTKKRLDALESGASKVAHKIAVKSKHLTHDAAVALSKSSAKLAKKLEDKNTHNGRKK